MVRDVDERPEKLGLHTSPAPKGPGSNPECVGGWYALMRANLDSGLSNGTLTGGFENFPVRVESESRQPKQNEGVFQVNSSHFRPL